MNDSLSALRRPVLDRGQIKTAAMITMVLNHIAGIFLTTDNIWYYILSGIGYFTCPVMCYFLTEGFDYTRDRKKYALRLLGVGILSQLPFYLAFRDVYAAINPGGGVPLNIMFTLFTCFLILVVFRYVMPGPLQIALVTALFLLTHFMDWPFMAAIMVICFFKAKEAPVWLPAGFVLGTVLVPLMTLLGTKNIVWALFLASGPVLAAVCIMFFYNGTEHGGIFRRKKEKASAFSKWFFYLFYPCHLLLLWAIREFVYLPGVR